METLEKPFHFISEKVNGIYDAMNKGISLSKGKWLYFLGADDTLKNSTVLEEVSKKLQSDVDVVSGKIQYQFSDSDSRQIQKNNGIFSSKWSTQIWIKNILHHQATFYQRNVFLNNQYNTNYQVLADYEFNLKMFKNKKKVKIISNNIAYCSSKGISKKYRWSMYKEEILFKTKATSIFLWPLFFMISLSKYISKKA